MPVTLATIVGKKLVHDISSHLWIAKVYQEHSLRCRTRQTEYNCYVIIIICGLKQITHVYFFFRQTRVVTNLGF